VIDQCLILLHPFMPFITEELWDVLAERSTMLIHADWPGYRAADLADEEADAEMRWVIAVIEEVRSVRAQMHVPAGVYVPVLVTEMDAPGRRAWERNAALIRRLARIESLEEVTAFPRGTATVALEGTTLGLPLEGLIDVDEEKARLEKTQAKLDKEIAGLSGRLSNPDFAANAPEEVVEEARENLAARRDERARIAAALARLSEIG
ncbi:MAG: class I tRNA ligase family protein, partial [Rhodosalinus sp.]